MFVTLVDFVALRLDANVQFLAEFDLLDFRFVHQLEALAAAAVGSGKCHCIWEAHS